MDVPYGTFSPTGQWTIPANTPTVMPATSWAPGFGQSVDPTTFFDASGKFVASGPTSIEMSAVLDLEDFPSYTGDLILQANFAPGSSSTSQPYIVASLKVSPSAATRVVLDNLVPVVQQGDQLFFTLIASQDLSQTISTDQVFSVIQYRDASQDTDEVFWITKSGSVPQMALKNKMLNMIGTTVTNGIAEFICTQDGSAQGESMFPNIISQAPMTLQSLTSDTTLTPPAWFFLPYPVGNQVLKAVFSDKTNGRWTATIQATGR